MIKYLQTEVVFQEVPNEVTLAINITNCQNNCPGCHSPELRQDIGEELTPEALDKLIEKNDGITCVCFMGEGNDHNALISLGEYLRDKYPDLRRAIYSGRTEVEDDIIGIFDYVKTGPYIESAGPLNSRTTNQRMIKVNHPRGETTQDWLTMDITDLFWRKEG